MSKIYGLSEDTKAEIRDAVETACDFWSNAGGDETRRENIRPAFSLIRAYADKWPNAGVRGAAVIVRCDAYRYADM